MSYELSASQPPQSDAQAYGFSGRRMQRMHRLQQSVEEEQPLNAAILMHI
jgi:hypothetical protein